MLEDGCVSVFVDGDDVLRGTHAGKVLDCARYADSDVEIGVQNPDEVDIHQVAAIFPYGNASVQVVEGGLDIAKPSGKGHTIIANAAVVVYFDMEAKTGAAS